MSGMNLSKIKADFKDRLFFYPADALYILDIAKALHIPAKDEYKLYSVMGSAELRNTLPLYTEKDFQDNKIDLNIKLPKTEEKIKTLIEELKTYANEQQSDLPVIFGLISDSKEAFSSAFKILIKEPLTYQNMRIVPAVQLPIADENKNIYELILYGFNPFDENWLDYIRRNKRTVKKLSEHNNRLFAGKFGFFSLSKIAPENDLASFIEKLVIQGINALHTLTEENYFNNPQIIKPLIEKFGLLETGSIKRRR